MEREKEAPAPGPPSTNITVTFSLSNFGFVSPLLCTSAIFSTELGAGAIAALIGGVNYPDKWTIVRAARGQVIDRQTDSKKYNKTRENKRQRVSESNEDSLRADRITR